MTKLSLIAGIAVLSAGLAHGAACLSDTAQNYVTNFGGSTGCTMAFGGDVVLFNNFHFTNNASGSTSGGGITQTTFTPITDANGVGFDFTWTTPFTASATGVNDDLIEFVATIQSGTAKIDDLFQSVTGSATTGNPTGSNIILQENFCPGGLFVPPTAPCPGNSPTNAVIVTQTNIPAGSSTTKTLNTTFGFSNSISIDKDIQLTGNNGSGAGAQVTDVKNQLSLSSVPEPSQFWLLALACCALIGFRSLRKRVNN